MVPQTTQFIANAIDYSRKIMRLWTDTRLSAIGSRRLPGVVVYAGINAWAKLRARRVGPGWERDDSARDNTAPTVRVVPAGEDGE